MPRSRRQPRPHSQRTKAPHRRTPAAASTWAASRGTPTTWRRARPRSRSSRRTEFNSPRKPTRRGQGTPTRGRKVVELVVRRAPPIAGGAAVAGGRFPVGAIPAGILGLNRCQPAVIQNEYTRIDRRHPGRLYTRTPNYAPPELIRSISGRLRTVCAHFPDEEFEILVQRMAHVQWKYDRRNHPDPLGRDFAR